MLLSAHTVAANGFAHSSAQLLAHCTVSAMTPRAWLWLFSCWCGRRAGLDEETVQLLQEFASVVYISCNPNTLVANLREVRRTSPLLGAVRT